jgi:hypothetical protein
MAIWSKSDRAIRALLLVGWAAALRTFFLV